MDKWKQPGVQAATQETSAGLPWIASSIWEVCVCVLWGGGYLVL